MSLLNMNDLKAVIVGFSASFMMFLILAPLIVLDLGPFNLPPPAAFLASIGWNIGILPWVVHFFYGILWSVVFVHFFGDEVSIGRGIGLAAVLWLLMMTVYSPLMGWGFFGFGEAHLLPVEDPLYLAQGWSYAGVTLLIHLVYGILIGWLNPLWEKVDTL